MKNVIVTFVSVVVILTVLISCNPETTPDINPNYDLNLNFTDVTLDDLSRINFGEIKVGESSETVSGTIENTGDTVFKINSIIVDNTDDFTVSVSELPADLESGDSVSFSVTFNPSDNGTRDAAVTVSYETDAVNTMSFNLIGTGNYAPEAAFGITVSDTTEFTQIEGFYVKDVSGDYYTMENAGITYYIYYYDSDGGFWAISDSMDDNVYPHYGEEFAPLAAIGPLTDIVYYYPIERQFDSSTNRYWEEIIEGYRFNSPTMSFYTGVTRIMNQLIADYVYTDSDDDEEADTVIAWYISDSADGTYTLIDGETAASYNIQSSDVGKYIKAIVIPLDSKGYEGEPVSSDPYYIETLIPLVT